MAEYRDVVRDHDPLWQPLAGVELGADDALRALEARSRNPLRHIDHIGLGCQDAERTRHFYEDILGMPLVMAIVLDDPHADGEQEYCHFFFEIGNGSFLAFFDHPRAFAPEDFKPRTGFFHHIAIEVWEDETVQAFRRKLEEAGIETRYTDHEVYHSLYFADPDGHNLEITYRSPRHDEFTGKSRKVARAVFDRWVNPAS